MTQQEFVAAVQSSIYDNPDGDIAAVDVADAIILSYDTAMQNSASGTPGSDSFNIIDRSGYDLNTLIDRGIYFVDGTNKPAHTHDGTLIITLKGADTTQTYHATDNYMIWSRTYNGTIWDAWEELPASHMSSLLMNMIIKKANKSSLPTIYSGETVPLDTLGKNYDRYHHFQTGSTTHVDLYDSPARTSYRGGLVTMAADYAGDPVQNGIAIIDIDSNNNLVFVDSDNSVTLPIEEITLEITHNGGTPVSIPLTVESNGAGSFTGSYDASFDSTIQGIVGINDNTSYSSFKLIAKEGLTTDKEYDYEKHNGHWERQDFLTEVKINELIREYSTIVEQTLVDQKKPTRAEALIAFKTLPHYNWANNDTFYIRDTAGGNKMVFCTYISDGATDEATAGPIFFKDMNETV